MRRRTITATALLVACTACGAPLASVELGDPRAVSAATNIGVAPMFAVSPSGTEAVAWISAPGGGTDGRMYVSIDGAPPVELADPLGPIEAHGESPPKIAYGADGAIHAVYVVGKVVPGRRFPLGALRHTRSADHGKTWSALATVTDDGDFGSHNFHALHAGRDGNVYVAWLDGRLGKSGTYIARSTDGGRTWSPNVRVSIEEACPCCRTAIASDTGGVVYLAWRTVLPGNVRDIVVARSADGGATWGTPERVHADEWVYEGCPHAGPSMVVDEKHRLHITWWTGKQGAAGVYYARSDDGLRFAEPVPMAVAATSRPSHSQLAVAGDRVAVTWDDGFTRVPTVHLRVSEDAGATFSAPTRVSPERLVATFPVIAFANGMVTVAWTEEDATAHAHKEAAHDETSDAAVPKGLSPVGNAKVMARTAVFR